MGVFAGERLKQRFIRTFNLGYKLLGYANGV